MFGPCFVIKYIMSFFDWEERAGCFTLSSWCLVTVCDLWLFLTVLWVTVVFPDHVTCFFGVKSIS